MTTDRLTTIQERGNGIARTARKNYRCRCAAPLRGYQVKGTYGSGWTSSYARTLEEAEQLQAEYRTRKANRRGDRYDTVEIIEDPNPNYRPDCLVYISAGDRYFENFDDSPAYQSGARYCSKCALAIWGKGNNDQPPVEGLRELLRF